MAPCFGEPPGGFCDVGCCCCFSSLEVFTFLSYFSLAPALHSGFSGPWRPSPALSSTLATFGCFTFCQAFFVTFSPLALRFWVGTFYPQAFFYLALLPHIFRTFLWLRCGQEHPIQDLPQCLPSVPSSVPSGWRMDLNCSYCSYKTIDLSIAPVSHAV